jgi:hypothetical protein
MKLLSQTKAKLIKEGLFSYGIFQSSQTKLNKFFLLERIRLNQAMKRRIQNLENKSKNIFKIKCIKKQKSR